MGKIAVFLGSFFTSVFSWLAKYLGPKLATIPAIIAVSLTMLVALAFTMKVLMSDLFLMLSIPYPDFVMAFYACWPSNAEFCIAACWSADIAVFIYKYKSRLMALVTSAQ